MATEMRFLHRSFSPLLLLIRVFLIAGIVFKVRGLDNGLARRPPMGWMSWAAFECQVDCQRHPHSCISEQLYREMADRLVEDGFREVGYRSVHIDDCWMEWERDGQGRLEANRSRFPSGIAELANYMHERHHLGLGIYEAVGAQTCANYSGSFGHYKQDAETFDSWGVDYLKMDGCNLNSSLFPEVYPEMSAALNRSGRPIVYACSWPDYYFAWRDHQEKINYSAVAHWCNVWRNYDDIERSWASVLRIIDWFTRNQEIFHAVQGPGRWNDPDMLIVGNPELTVDQARVQMSIWAIWSAPLIMSNDLRSIAPEFKEILLNRRVIAVDQDPLGEFGRMVFEDANVRVYVKRMTPADIDKEIFSFALAILNSGSQPAHFRADLRSLGLTEAGGFALLDLWTGQQLGNFSADDFYNVSLAATSVAMLKATPLRLWQV